MTLFFNGGDKVRIRETAAGNAHTINRPACNDIAPPG